MRFHLLGLSHCPTTKEYSACAFSQKARLLSRMLHEAGHTVYFYGVEGSEVQCTEFVQVLDRDNWASVHLKYDWRKDGFDLSCCNAASRTFNSNSVKEIEARAEPMDFILCPFGTAHRGIAGTLPGLIAVEPGIGYEQTFAKFRVFESYAWMHYIYGVERKMLNPPMYDAVIPPFFDLDDFPFRVVKDDYFLFIGRPTTLKGLNIASDVCKVLGVKLYAAGQGDLPEGIEAEWLGVLSFEERGKWMSGARAVFAPTYYIEPGGYVAIEAGLCATPVITTDMGCFTETVRHGVTGYRCRTLEQFIWAAENVHRIDPSMCRLVMGQNYGLDRIEPKYEEYFGMLSALHRNPEGWYARNPERKNLDWLAV